MIRPTEIRRQPLTQEANVIVSPCERGLLRTVQLLIPGGDPKVYVGESVMPNEIGPNRVYKLAPFPPGTTIRFTLGPEQWLVAATNISTTAITIIVEYAEMPANYNNEPAHPPAAPTPTRANPTRELLDPAVWAYMERRR